MDSCSLFSCFPAELILTMRLGRGEEHSRGKCPPPDSDPFNAVEYGEKLVSLSRRFVARLQSVIRVLKTQLAFYRHAKRNAFRRRVVSRLLIFAKFLESGITPQRIELCRQSWVPELIHVKINKRHSQAMLACDFSNIVQMRSPVRIVFQ